MSEISYHQNSISAHQKREKTLPFCADISSSSSFWCWEISARTGLDRFFYLQQSGNDLAQLLQMCRDHSLFFPISLLQLRKHWSVFCSLLFWV